MTQYNKATAAIVSGAIVTGLGLLVPGADPALLGAVQTVLTGVFVYLIPNATKE